MYLIIPGHHDHGAGLQQGRADAFAPDTRFTVANAMRANKYQYALSDAAVVVETRQHGGVWSGADENRNEGWVPAFVRTAKDMAPGNTALLHLGLNAIPQDEIDSGDDLRDIFLGVSSPRTQPRNIDDPALAPTDLYALFLHDLKTWLAADARSESEIVAHFGLERSQVRAWLQRAVTAQELRKLVDQLIFIVFKIIEQDFDSQRSAAF